MLIDIEDEVIVDFDSSNDDSLVSFFEYNDNLEGIAIIKDYDGSYIWIEDYIGAIDRSLVLFNLTKELPNE